MKKAKIIISKDFIIDKTDNRLFGSFVEHMGSVVHNGIFEPNHPKADENGFRKDVLKYVDELELSVVRYPGGNFTSAFDWKKMIGPIEDRERTVEPAWRQIEPNTFGLNEFMQWVSKLDIEPIMTINLGTQGIQDAADIVEYCNFDKGTKWSDLRIEHGVKKPYNIKVWCLGNELDGEWQVAQKTADEYGRLARQAAKVMKRVDPNIELVSVGSSARFLDSFPSWDKTVMMHTYDLVDYISVHAYINKKEDDTPTYLARPIEVEKQISEVIAACDYVKGTKGTDKIMYLSFDEFNVHKEPEIEYEPWKTGCPFDWCRYNIEDTLVFGSMLLAILRNSDRIKIACQSLLVNTIPLILTLKGKDAWRNPIYYVLQHVSKFGRGTVLRSVISGPTYEVDFAPEVQALDQIAVIDSNGTELTLFCINRLNEPIETKLMVKEDIIESSIEHIVLKHDDLTAVNTIDNQDNIEPIILDETIKVTDDTINITVDPYSWNVVRISLKENA